MINIVVKMALETETKFFADHKDELLAAHPGQFVLIKGDQLVGAFSLEKDAYVEGVKRFGTEPFMIKQVLKDEPVANYLALQFGLINARP